MPHPTPTLCDATMDALQRDTFAYFLHEANPANGLVADKTQKDCPASIAATGLALSAYPVAVERGFMTRAHAAERTLATLRFFHHSPQGPEPDATGHKGFYYHFLDMQTGRRAWTCELSTVDTGFLLAGMLTAAAYFTHPGEHEIPRLAQALYERVDWTWAQDGQPTLVQGWTPETGFFPYRWQGYDEALFLYVLALGSPTHPIGPAAYQAWCASYQWRTVEGIDYLHAAPLFTHQISHLWIDLRGIQDPFMREKGLDYFENSRRATHIQRAYAIRNPQGFAGYGPLCWGITATDGPGPLDTTIAGRPRHFDDYIARGVPDGPDDGCIAPWAVLASLPFAPEIVLPAFEYFDGLKIREANTYGFKATFNMTFTDSAHCHGNCGFWVSPYHYGLDQGPIVLMIENVRTAQLWDLLKTSAPFVTGLRRAGFTGGWLGA